ncbi:M15 family metallopeptidase [Leucobacter sp. CSA1]|uniref:M15 family metallopeptidase n=1 Tax=Leucobacter chromiisoli TaxID=2796471 RepID=A0A934Q6S0_9MICO|nr:M15 family metallopeptidase [Leucobacter chromiisoli]MBK0418405.1 M15 family metallopeptidase [Leucobacter chromiisoli]
MALPPLPGSAVRRRPARRLAQRRRALIAGAAALVLLLGGGTAAWAVIGQGEPEPARAEATPEPEPTIAEPEPTPTPTPEPPAPEPEPEPEPPAHDLDTPESITVVVNKQRPLPEGWEPQDLVMPAGIANTNGQPMRAEAAQALETMYAEAAAAGYPFVITSAYRSYDMQVGLFDSYVARDGVAAAETYSARAGHSEHQTGLAADLDDGSGCAFMSCFGETPTGVWLAENAHRFGFILRYHQGAEPVVGYMYEPWHFRYVGVDVATDMMNRGEQNLETYFGLPAAPTY